MDRCDLHPFVTTLERLNDVYRIAYAKDVDSNHVEIIEQFELTWLDIMKPPYNTTMPLKIHIIVHHLSDFFVLTGTTLRKVSDQVIESAHHKVKTFFDLRPNYNHKEKESVESGKATLAGVIHFNANNLGSVL